MKLLFSTLKELIKGAKEQAKDEVSSDYPVLRSRGNFCSSHSTDDKIEEEQFTSKSDLLKFIEVSIINPAVECLWIDGGFDGADSVQAMNNYDYEALVSDWGFKIWDRQNGFLSLNDIESNIQNEKGND